MKWKMFEDANTSERAWRIVVWIKVMRTPDASSDVMARWDSCDVVILGHQNSWRLLVFEGNVSTDSQRLL
jgi:hypothetical protein